MHLEGRGLRAVARDGTTIAPSRLLMSMSGSFKRNLADLSFQWLDLPNFLLEKRERCTYNHLEDNFTLINKNSDPPHSL